MLRRLKNTLPWIRRFRSRLRRRNEEGQAITEYGAIIAFIAVLISLVFAFGSSEFGLAVSHAFSSVVQQLNDLVAQSNSAS